MVCRTVLGFASFLFLLTASLPVVAVAVDWHFQLAVEGVAALIEEPPRIVHPPWVMQWEEVEHLDVLTCSAVLFIFGILCSAGGIGGGGVYVTALVAAGGLSLRDAVPLSKAIVFFGALATLTINVKKTNSAEGGVIDLDTCKVMIPSALIGTFWGVLLNHDVDDATILTILSVLLVFMMFLLFQTAWRQHQEELALEARLGGLPDPAAGADVEASRKVPLSEDIFVMVWTLLVVTFSGIMHFHIKHCRLDHLDGSSWEAHSSCNHPILRSLFGGKFSGLIQDWHSAMFFQAMALCMPTFACCAVASYYASDLRRRGRWSDQKLVGYQAVATFTGCFAGLVGVGGGLIFAPLFLLTGMDPSIAVGTSSTCVLFTSSSTTVQYLFTDRIIMSLAFVYGVVSIAASSSGTTLVHLLRTRFPLKKSYITLIVAASVAACVFFAFAKALGVVSAAVHQVEGAILRAAA